MINYFYTFIAASRGFCVLSAWVSCLTTDYTVRIMSCDLTLHLRNFGVWWRPLGSVRQKGNRRSIDKLNERVLVLLAWLLRQQFAR